MIETLTRRLPPRDFGTLAVLALLALYLVLGLTNLQCPGLGYDETNWANVALGDIDGSWIGARFLGIPWLLSLTYIGTLKGFLMEPVFALFGVSAYSARVPMVLFGLGALIAAYRLARHALPERWQAVLALGFLAINPEWVLRMRQDFGPVAIDLFLKEVVILAALACARRPGLGILSLLMAIEAFGLWNKLTFVWYIAAVNFALLIVYPRVVLSFLAPGRRAELALILVSQAAFAAYFLYVYVTFNIGGWETARQVAVGPFDRVVQFWNLLLESARGTASIWYSFAYWTPDHADAWGVTKIVLAAIGIIASLAGQPRARGDAPDRVAATRFYGWSAFFCLAFLAATRAADKPWHLIASEPFLTIGLFQGAVTMGGLVHRAGRVLAPVAVTGLGLLVMAQVWTYLPGAVCAVPADKTSWGRATSTMQIYTLIDYVVARPETHFMILDWGIRNQALMFSRNRHPAATELPADDFRAAADRLFADPAMVFIVHSEMATCDMAGRDALFDEARKRGLTLEKVHEIDDGLAVIFEFWRVARAE